MNRLTAILLGAVLFLGIAIFYAAESWLAMLAVLLSDGLLAAAWVAAAAGVGSLLLRAAGVSANRVLVFVTSAALGLGIFSILALGLGLAGWLNRFTATALPAGSGLLWIGLLLRRRGGGQLDLRPISQWLNHPAGWGWLWLVAVPFAAMAAVGAASPPGAVWHPTIDPVPYDIFEYHLQVPREWFELGRIVPLHHNVYSFFPFNVEMQYLLAMHVRGGPWAGMYLAQYLTMAYAVLGVLAIYGIAREIAPRATPLGALAAVAAPWTTLLAPVCYNESGLLLYGALAVGWALYAMRCERFSWRTWAMAGTMAGLACGVKLTAVPMVVALVPGAIVAVVLLRQWAGHSCPAQPAGQECPAYRVKGCIIFVVVGVVAFSPWFVRNGFWAGNPVFPEAMSVLGPGHFTAEQVHRWQTEHAAHAGRQSPMARMSAGLANILAPWQYGFVLWPLAAISAGLAFRRSDAQVLLILLLGLAVFWLGFTHLQGRFFVFGIPLAAMLIDQASVRWVARATFACLLVLGAMFVWLAVPITYGPGGSMHAAGMNGLTSAILHAYGTEDLKAMLPGFLSSESLAERAMIGRPVALVGDAQAFRYPLPMSRLRYRTVFDVNRGGARDIVEAWLGGTSPAPGEIILIFPQELERLAATYADIAPLPATWKQPLPYEAELAP